MPSLSGKLIFFRHMNLYYSGREAAVVSGQGVEDVDEEEDSSSEEELDENEQVNDDEVELIDSAEIFDLIRFSCTVISEKSV